MKKLRFEYKEGVDKEEMLRKIQKNLPKMNEYFEKMENNSIVFDVGGVNGKENR